MKSPDTCISRLSQVSRANRVKIRNQNDIHGQIQVDKTTLPHHLMADDLSHVSEEQMIETRYLSVLKEKVAEITWKRQIILGNETFIQDGEHVNCFIKNKH